MRFDMRTPLGAAPVRPIPSVPTGSAKLLSGTPPLDHDVCSQPACGLPRFMPVNRTSACRREFDLRPGRSGDQAPSVVDRDAIMPNGWGVPCDEWGDTPEELKDLVLSDLNYSKTALEEAFKCGNNHDPALLEEIRDLLKQAQALSLKQWSEILYRLKTGCWRRSLLSNY